MSQYKRFETKYLTIIITASILIIWAISLLLALFRVKFNLIVTIAIITLITSIFSSVFSLIKLGAAGRILAITCLFLLSIVSVGGILFAGTTKLTNLIFWLIILVISILLIYLLNCKKIREMFKSNKTLGPFPSK